MLREVDDIGGLIAVDIHFPVIGLIDRVTIRIVLDPDVQTQLELRAQPRLGPLSLSGARLRRLLRNLERQLSEVKLGR